MSLAGLSPLANHLWQSTLFVAVVALLAFLLKRNRAQVRYWLWLAASVKFLVPFSALVAVGSQVGWRSSTNIVQPQMSFVIGVISQPFALPQVTAVPQAAASNVPVLPVVLCAIWFCGCAMHLLAWCVRWQRVAGVVRRASPLEDGRELEVLRRLEGIVGTRQPIAIVTSDTSLEPGVFGILTPVLIWPRSIGGRLADRQLEAILAHELCHVRRRDNLAVAIHMVVEALFWFHPLVWWLEQRLVDERERACDEEVIRLGSEPQFYAEGILRTCEFYVEAPSIVAGVTGSDLKKRIEAIMSGHSAERLNTWKKIALAMIGVFMLAVPIVNGVLNAARLHAQSPAPAAISPAFEVASVKPNKSGEQNIGGKGFGRGRWDRTNAPLKMLILEAFGVRSEQLVGLPAWAGTERFDVDARTGTADVNRTEALAMMQGLLKERFGLTSHRETRDVPTYDVLVGRVNGTLGPGLQRTEHDCSAMTPAQRPEGMQKASPGEVFCGWYIRTSQGTSAGDGQPLAILLAQFPSTLGRPVVNKTGLTGPMSWTLKWRVDDVQSDAPELPTAFQEQLGLKLVSSHGPLDVIVIDHVERPTPD
jgi:uncharacterized protein (TIGR03435 family)